MSSATYLTMYMHMYMNFIFFLNFFREVLDSQQNWVKNTENSSYTPPAPHVHSMPSIYTPSTTVVRLL